jgi:hypothetical protein
MDELLKLLIPALVGAVTAYLAASSQNMREVKTRIDAGVRDARLNMYPALWRLTELLPLWPPALVTYEQLYTLSSDMQHWYFNQGGLYLSTTTKQAYLDAQGSIGGVLMKHELIGSKQINDKTVGVYRDLSLVAEAIKTKALADEEYVMVRQKLSDLRTQLTADLSSRRNVPDWISEQRD